MCLMTKTIGTNIPTLEIRHVHSPFAALHHTLVTLVVVDVLYSAPAVKGGWKPPAVVTMIYVTGCERLHANTNYIALQLFPAMYNGKSKEAYKHIKRKWKRYKPDLLNPTKQNHGTMVNYAE